MVIKHCIESWAWAGTGIAAKPQSRWLRQGAKITARALVRSVIRRLTWRRHQVSTSIPQFPLLGGTRHWGQMEKPKYQELTHWVGESEEKTREALRAQRQKDWKWTRDGYWLTRRKGLQDLSRKLHDEDTRAKTGMKAQPTREQEALQCPQCIKTGHQVHGSSLSPHSPAKEHQKQYSIDSQFVCFWTSQ